MKGEEGYTEEESRDENIQENSQTYSTIYSEYVHKYDDYKWNELPAWVKEAVKNHWVWKDLDKWYKD